MSKINARSTLSIFLIKLQIFVQAHQSPPKVSVAELLQQLTVTQAELENIKVKYNLLIIYDSKNTALTNMAIQLHNRLTENFIHSVQDERFSMVINKFQIELLLILKRFKRQLLMTVFFSEFITFSLSSTSFHNIRLHCDICTE